MLKDNKQGKPKVLTNTVRNNKPGVKVPGKGGINPQFNKTTQKLSPSQPFVDLVSAKDAETKKVSVGPRFMKLG